ncbi:hypothetical protein JM654_20610 [Microbacterium oxydans]|nr:hypothetical protein [Microbacterium oxydans]
MDFSLGLDTPDSAPAAVPHPRPLDAAVLAARAARSGGAAAGWNHAAPPNGAVQACRTTTPPDSTSASRGEAEVTASNAGARAKVGGRGAASTSSDLVVITGAGAARGDHRPVRRPAAASPIPDLTIGETFSGSEFEMTVVGVELRDERGMAAIYPDEEKGAPLVVTVDVVNTFSQPRFRITREGVSSPGRHPHRRARCQGGGVAPDDGKLAPTPSPTFRPVC